MISRFALGLCLFAASTGFAQEPPSVSPGKEHKLLHKNIGERTGMMKMWPAGPDSDPMMIPVKETNTLLHNGLWVRSVFECGPYVGSGVLGYDPEKKKYVGNWINNQTANMSVMEGTYNEDKKVLTMKFRGKNNSGKTVDMKSLTTFNSPETFVMMQKGDGGQWEKVFEVTYEK